MLKAVLRWTLIIGSLFAVGPLAATLIDRLRDVDGGHAVTLLINGSMGAGLGAGAVLFGAALVVGLIGSHFFSLNTGMVAAGLVLAWGRFGEGRLEDIVRRAGTGKDLPTLAIEGALVALAGALLTWCLMRVAHSAQQAGVPSAPDRTPPRGSILITGPSDEKPFQVLGMSLLAGGVAAAAVVWLVALSSAPGQTFAAALLASVAAGGLAQVMAGSKDCHLTPVGAMLPVVLIAAAGPIVAIIIQGQGQAFVEAVYAGKVFALSRPISLDWGAGAVLGVPIGMGFAGIRLDKRHQ